jgi:sarcosine oxidase subunit gamma
VADLQIETRDGFGLVAIMAHRNADPDRMAAALGGTLPTGPTRTVNEDGLSLIGTGPGQWLAHADNQSPFWADALRDRLAGLAAVSDQSSAYHIFRLTGRDARTLLQRGMAIDLHPGAFGPGSVATTVIAHIGLVVWQIDDRPSYDVAVFRSHAASFRQWLDHIAAAI